MLFIADGARVLWDLKKEFFPEAEECLDWFHAVEKLWYVGKAIHRGTRRERKAYEAWVARMKKTLRTGKVYEILGELRATLDTTPLTGPGNKYRREALEKAINHFTENARRMRYRHLRDNDLPIASGVIEGAVRHLVGVRLDGPGMRWGPRPRRGCSLSTLRPHQRSVVGIRIVLRVATGFPIARTARPDSHSRRQTGHAEGGVIG